MKKKEVSLLVALALLAFGSLVYGIRTPARQSKGSPASLPAALSPVVANAISGPSVRPPRKNTEEAWGRNPFAFGSVSSQSFAGLTLNGIFWDSVKPRAIIGGQIVGVGDAVTPGGAKVEEIRPNKVVLNDGKDKIELMLD